jgi:hypothetical protein
MAYFSYTSVSERRASVRYPVREDVTGKSVRDEEGKHWDARVYNLSAGGICLIVNHRVQPGELLQIELATKDDKGARRLLARVVRVESDSPGSGWWRAGCSFAKRLTDFELLALL